MASQCPIPHYMLGAPHIRSSLGMGSFVFNFPDNEQIFRALVTKVFNAGPVYLSSPKVGRSGAWEV